jgi:predicted  nucleic acid-binding Zn-ribbon protein
MQNALKTLWTDELSDQLRQLSAPQNRRPAPTQVAENVVRAPFPQRAAFPGVAPQQKPELSAALDAVVKAADLIKNAQERAAYAEEHARNLADRTAEQLNQAEQQIQALQERARSAEERLNAVTERAAEKLADADAQIRAARDEAKRHEQRATAAEQRVNEEVAHAKQLLKEADERIFAAETRAMESKEDLAYLENYIRERFAL